MASSYKTPGVYVEEITKFPPSVAEVETAIPAFIGYTEKATRFISGDLNNVPFRIKSLLDFEQYFGVGPAYDVMHIELSSVTIINETNTTVNNSIYNLYESMRLFYDNGGGVCYVCSVGTYDAGDNDADRATKMINGLAELKKYDEPTLLLCPDAVSLRNAGAVDYDKIAQLQQAALKQCGDLGDRFALLDVPETDASNVEEQADSFRSKVGMNYLKYGAAYTPFLKTVYEKSFRMRDIDKNLFLGNTPISLSALFTEADKDVNGVTLKSKFENFNTLWKDNAAMNARLSLYSGQTVNDTFQDRFLDEGFQAQVSAFNAAASGATGDNDRLSSLKAAFEHVYASFAQLEGLVNAHAAETDSSNDPGPISGKPIRTSVIANEGLRDAIEGLLGTNLKQALQDLVNLDHEAYRKGGPDISNTNANKPSGSFALFTASAWAPGAASDEDMISGASLTEKGSMTMQKLSAIHQAIKGGINSAISNGLAFESATEKALSAEIPVYNSILRVLNSKTSTVPPSGAVAGVYAAVDRDRGVWKAPANVSLNSVSGVSETIDDNTQEGLNVDVNAGKSINAIRPFFGKGILVWGARTLAGNDNEWRYVPVRRLFSFAEESCRKSTSWCVFEPNDANTWSRIRGQIDSFMNSLWRRGALAGAKPEHAYYVNCGLGITMTAQDLLEGRLIVEIGMAAVRPAEFVILKFSHKLQQS